MPTIIALDNSLSMQRVIPGRESRDNSLTFSVLATKGITQLLEHLSTYSKMEYVALVTYSSTVEIKVDFTREYDQVRQVLKKLEAGDKACVFTMLKSIASMLSTNWGAQSCAKQVVVFSDLGIGLGNTSIKNLLAAIAGKEKEPDYAWISSLKNIKLNWVCLGLNSDPIFTGIAMPLYQQLHDFFSFKGQLFAPKSNKDTTVDGESTPATNNSSHKSELGRTVMCEMIERLCDTSFKPFETILKCGGYFRLECPIFLWPPPVPHKTSSGNQMTLASKIEVCGFLSINEIGSPASLSRHLVLPKIERERPTRRSSEKSSSQKASTSSNVANSTKTLDLAQPNAEYEKLEQDIRDFYSKDNDDSNDDVIEVTPRPTESVCVLLHGALKVENCAAVVLLNDNWFGFLYSYSDSKKKSNLILNILPPGTNCIPWLGDFQLFGFQEDLLAGDNGAFPVKAEKRSYSQNCVVWIRNVSLQSDVQKVLRHAKKMPEKTQHFYKELNRIRRAALSLGFVELLEAMALLFEKESTQLALSAANPGKQGATETEKITFLMKENFVWKKNYNPPNLISECCLQLKHAAMELRKPANRDLKISIVPAQKFGPVGASPSTFIP